jgi:23S rRNA (guanine745-N1)-methyltransferase
VRGCGRPLQPSGARLVCERAHSFDIARSGYVNLLQPQDSRSKEPGDTREAVAARRRLHDRGVTAPLLRGIAESLQASHQDTVLDAGCGDGFYLGSLAGEFGFAGCGVDISIPAIDAAARRYRECIWVVANADRFLPYADASFSLAMSITARMNSAEFHRVLREGGRLLVAIPAPDDLIELRGPSARDRVGRTVESFGPHFDLLSQTRTTAACDLDAAGIHDVLHSIYRPLRPQPAEAMHVTFSLDLLMFRKR